MQSQRYARWVFVPLLALAAASCQKSEGIQQYIVAKVEPANPQVEAPEGTQLAWFFKLTGPVEALRETQLQEFGNLIRSVTVEGNQPPRFKLPKGWTQEKGAPPRYLTLKGPGSDSPLEVAVTALPAPDPNSLEYLMANLNRWRGQLGLEADTSPDWYEDAEAKGELARVFDGSQTISMVHLIGETEDYGATRMIVAMVAAGGDPSTMAEHHRPSSRPSPEFVADVPESWESAPASQFAVAAYSAKNEAGTMEVSVSIAGGGVLANVNRWRNQVGLSPLSEVEFAKNSVAHDVGGAHGTYVELMGPEEGILGAIVTHNGQQWFFKGRGPVEAVRQELPRFQKFIESVKFE